MSSVSIKNVINKRFTNHTYLIHMYEQDLALNNQQWLLRCKTQPNQTNTFQMLTTDCRPMTPLTDER